MFAHVYNLIVCTFAETKRKRKLGWLLVAFLACPRVLVNATRASKQGAGPTASSRPQAELEKAPLSVMSPQSMHSSEASHWVPNSDGSFSSFQDAAALKFAEKKKDLLLEQKDSAINHQRVEQMGKEAEIKDKENNQLRVVIEEMGKEVETKDRENNQLRIVIEQMGKEAGIKDKKTEVKDKENNQLRVSAASSLDGNYGDEQAQRRLQDEERVYTFHSQLTSWFNAREACWMFGGDLATARSEAENDKIFEVRGGADAWIGYTDLEEYSTEGTWVWQDGSTADFTNWATAQPDDAGGNEDCALLLGDKTWSDADCGANFAGDPGEGNSFICQIEITFAPTRTPMPVSTPAPTLLPTLVLTSLPTPTPTINPSPQPTLVPTSLPTQVPTIKPSLQPSKPNTPTLSPTPAPKPKPTPTPTTNPTFSPTPTPTSKPTSSPAIEPTLSPTPAPTPKPTPTPTTNPTFSPTPTPTSKPTSSPTIKPTSSPTPAPTPKPTPTPTSKPTPTPKPTLTPTQAPTQIPTPSPSKPTPVPTQSAAPTGQPTHIPTPKPSNKPTSIPSSKPTAEPTQQPTSVPTLVPSPFPTLDCTPSNYMFRVDMFAEGTFASGQGGWGALSFGIYTTDAMFTNEMPAKNTGTLREGAFGAAFACLPDDCYAFQVGGSSDPAWDTSWALLETAGNGAIVGTRETRSLFCTVNGTISSAPTLLPTQSPAPSLGPTPGPTPRPFPAPSPDPTTLPTPRPSLLPTRYPSNVPTPSPTEHCNRGEFMNDVDECEKCGAGRYSNVSHPPWPRECTLCPVGKVSPQLGRVADCFKCPVGKFSSADRDYCGDCQAGDYLFNKTACIKCPFGRYAPTAVNDECVYCGSGFATNASIGATRCADCSPGSYSEGGSAVCTSCAPGAASASRASQCTDCSPGSAAPESGATACVACATGTHANGSKAVACDNCPAGKAQSAPGQSQCANCLPGSAAPERGTAACVACAAGTHANGSKAVACDNCPVGRAQSAPGQSSCPVCIIGSFASAEGQAACQVCASGTVAPAAEAASCRECLAGQAMASPGQGACVECEAGSFNGKTGQATCLDCPGNFYSMKGAPRCVLCLKGFFYSLTGICVECSTGLTCDADGGSTQQELTIVKGYWRLTGTTDIVRACPLPGSCTGGSAFVEKGQQQRRLSQDSDIYCEKGYVGPMCAVCDSDEGYFFDPDLQQCLSCETQGGIGNRFMSSTSLIVPLVIMVAVLLVLSLAFAVGRAKRKGEGGGGAVWAETAASTLKLNKGSMVVNQDGSLTFHDEQHTEPPKAWKLKTSVTHTSMGKVTKSTSTITVVSETTKVKTTIKATNNRVLTMVASVRETKNKVKALTAFSQISINVAVNCRMEFPEYFTKSVVSLKVLNMDIVGSLGLGCTFSSFNFLDKLVVMTLGPLTLIAVLGLAYLAAITKFKSSKDKAETARRLENVYLVPQHLLGSFNAIDILRFQILFASFDLTGSGFIDRGEVCAAIKKYSSNIVNDDGMKKYVDDLLAEAQDEGGGSVSGNQQTTCDKIQEQDTALVISFAQFMYVLYASRIHGTDTKLSALCDRADATVSRTAGQGIFYAMMLVTFLFLISSSTMLFHYLVCESFPESEDGTESYLTIDLSVDCDSTTYKSYFAYVMIMIFLFPIGIPSAYVVLLWRQRSTLSDPQAMSREMSQGYPTVGHVLFLTEAYKPQFYYWEAIECIRRLLLGSVVGVVSTNPVVAPVLGLACSTVFSFLFTASRPFQNADDSSLGILLSNTVSVFFVAALIILAGFIGEDDSNSQSAVDGIMVGGLLLGPLFIFVQLVRGNMKLIATAVSCPKKAKSGENPTTDPPTENTAPTESAGNDESVAAKNLPFVVARTTSDSSLVEEFKAGREETKTPKVLSSRSGRRSHPVLSRASSLVVPSLRSPRTSKSFAGPAASGYISRSASRSGRISVTARSMSSSFSPSVNVGDNISAESIALSLKSPGAEQKGGNANDFEVEGGNVAQDPSLAFQTGQKAVGGSNEKKKGGQVLAEATKNGIEYV